MKTLLIILLATLCAATGYAQTMKALLYNVSNGVVTYSSTNTLTFTTSANFEADIFASSFETGSGTNFTQVTPDGLQFGHAGIAAATRTNLGLPLPALTNTNVTNFLAAIGLSATNNVSFNSVAVTNAAATRTNLSLGLPALTNTSNVTIMRALAGSTNTNAPISSSVELSDGVITWLLTFSNGILVNLYEQ